MDFERYQEALRERVGVRDLPFHRDEFAARQHHVLRRMDEASLDLLLVTDPSDIFYLTGYNTFEVSVHCCLILAPGGNVLQVPSIETGPAVTGSVADRVVGYRWEGPRGVVRQLADAMRALVEGRHHPRVGIDGWQAGLRAGVVDGLREALDGWSFVDATVVIDRVRLVKSEAELAMLRQSARATEAGLDAAGKAIQPGVTDTEVAAAAAQGMHQAGGEFMSMQPIVVAGWRSSVIHTNHRRYAIESGDPVFMEMGAAWHRYTAPMMRTVVAGSVTAEMTRVFECIQALYASLCEHMKPGRTFHEAAAAADNVLAPWHDQVFFSGVYGYSVGAQFPPSWVEGTGFIAAGDETPFQENMVFHLPLCLRLPGRWGIGFSETVRVTSAGAEPITRNHWRLVDMR